MRAYGLGRLKRWLRRTTAPLRSQVVVLLYHRVFGAPSDPQRLCVTPGHFAEHLEVLRSQYTVLGLSALMQMLREGKLPKRAIVITFDDGYVDNLWYARPLLERYEVPATVLVTTGYMGEEREFWWDELERLVLWTPQLPERLRIRLGTTMHEWSLNGGARLSKGAEQPLGAWHVELPHDPTPRHRAYRELHRLLQPLGWEAQQEALSQLRAQANDPGTPREGYRALRPQEVIKLAEDGLVEIGSHTETHPVLAARPPEEQQREIRESKRKLEAVLGRPVQAFAYPYGGRSHIGDVAIKLVKESGYSIAFANFGGCVTGKTHPLLLPRYLVRDWDGDEFAKRLTHFFRG